MSDYVTRAQRQMVIERAHNCCEYCRISADFRFWAYEIDHIIARKHGGTSATDNLAWACYLCNGYKGSDLGSIDWAESRQLTPLFHPRQHEWHDHFAVDAATGLLQPETAEGRVSVFLLRLNEPDHLATRLPLIGAGLYPCPIVA